MKSKYGYVNEFKDVNIKNDNDLRKAMISFKNHTLETQLKIIKNLERQSQRTFIEYLISITNYKICDELYEYHKSKLKKIISNGVGYTNDIMTDYENFTKNVCGIPSIPMNYITNPQVFKTDKHYTQNKVVNKLSVLLPFVIQHKDGILFNIYTIDGKIDSGNHPIMHSKERLFLQDYLEQFIIETIGAFDKLRYGYIDDALNKFNQGINLMYGVAIAFFTGNFHPFIRKYDGRKVKNHCDERMIELTNQYRNILRNHFEIEFEKLTGKTIKQYKRDKKELDRKMKALKRELGDLF